VLDENGGVKQQISLGALSKGEQSIPLRDIALPNGPYTFRLSAIGADGLAFNPVGNIAGIVKGFIPGADPALIVNGREVKVSEITRVNLPAGY